MDVNATSWDPGVEGSFHQQGHSARIMHSFPFMYVHPRSSQNIQAFAKASTFTYH